MKITPNIKKAIFKAVVISLSAAVLVFLVALPFKEAQFLMLSAAYSKSKDTAAKLSAYDKFVKLHPYYIPARLKLARLYVLLDYANPNEPKNYESAVEQYEVILKLDAKNKDALSDLGDLYSGKKKFEDADKLFKKLIKYYPKSPGYHHKLALNYLRQDINDKALEEITLTLSLDPENGGAHLLKGMLLEKQENMPDAIAEYETALRIFKERKLAAYEIDAQANLGRAYFKAGLIFDSLQQFEKIVRMNPNMIQGYLELASAYYNINLVDKCISTLEALLKLRNAVPDAYRMLGFAYLKKADYIAALSYFKKAEAYGIRFEAGFIDKVDEAAKAQREKPKQEQPKENEPGKK